LEVDEVEALGVFRSEDGPRVLASGYPDGQHARDEDQVRCDDDEPEEVEKDSVSDDAGQGDGEGDLGPCRGEGGHGGRRVLEEEESALVIVGGVAGGDGAGEEAGGNQQDALSERVRV
jgi:hypothetical protein